MSRRNSMDAYIESLFEDGPQETQRSAQRAVGKTLSAQRAMAAQARAEAARAAIPEQRAPRIRRVDNEDKIANPATGKLVRADGRAGRAIRAAQRRELENAGVIIPRGALRARAQVPGAVPGVVERDDLFMALRRGYQRAGAFTLQRWNIPGRAPETVAQFAQSIARAREAIPQARRRHVNIDFVDEDGARITRAITGRTTNQLVEQIDKIQGQGIGLDGSDVIGTGFRLDTTTFALGSVHPPGGGALRFTGISKKAGTRHPHFRLTDFSGKLRESGDCLFAIMRAVAATLALKPDEGWPRNSTIRSQLGLPPAPENIPADNETIDKIASYFRLRVRVITGMAVPPDAEREYDDNPARLIGRNSCRTVAAPVVIAEGGPEDASPCDVFLANEHYEYIAEFLRVATCPYTGDIVNDAELDPGTNHELGNTPWLSERIISQGRPFYADDTSALEDKLSALVARNNPDTAQAQYREHVIVFDYETVYNPEDGTLEPYALGFFVFNPEAAACRAGDFAAAVDKVVQVIRGPGESRYAVTNALIDTMCRAPADVRYTLVSFNGSRFDNFLLAQGANNRGLLNDIFATTSGGLRDVRIGRHETLDLAKLAPAMSLASACAGFKTSPVKVEGFSHLEPQAAYERGELFTRWLPNNRVKLAEYLAGDVLSTASLFMKLTRTLSDLSDKPCYGDRAVKTIGGHAFAMMSDKCELPGPVASEELDRYIRKAVVGGRVEVYDDPLVGKAPRIELEPAYMVDFASLYPTVMAAVPSADRLFEPEDGWGVYPDAIGAKAAGEQAADNVARRAGRPADASAQRKIAAARARAAKAFRDAVSEPVHAGAYQPGVPGLYKVTIHEQPPGLPNLVPRRGETLDWGHRGEFDAVISHITIALIRRYGGRVTVHSGYVWEKASRGLFEPFIRDLARVKDQQDALAPTDPDYNPALRMVAKLLMNAASGKCCQANYEDCVVIARGAGQQLLAESKMCQDSPTIWIPLGGETCIIIGKKPEEKVYTRRAKPSILAVLIYEYSRALVWRTLCQHNVLYSDTDSGIFRAADYEALRAAFPELDPTDRVKKLGDLEQELKPHKSATLFRMAPKDYGVFLRGEDGNLLPRGHKIRMKGVNQRSDRLLKPGAADLLRGRPMQELASAYNTTALDLSEPLSDPEVALRLYERRAAGETVEVLCSQLMRGTLSVERPLELYQRFLIKKLGPVTAQSLSAR